MGQDMGQKGQPRINARKKYGKPNKTPAKSKDFTGVLARREGFEPPAFWSVAALKGKMQAFSVLSEPIVSGSISFLTLFCPLTPLEFFLFWVKL